MKKTTFFSLTLLVLSTIGLQTTFAEQTFNYRHSISSVEFSPDGNTLAFVASDGTAKFVDVAILEITLNINVSPTSVAFSPDGKFLAIGRSDSKVYLLDIPNREFISVFTLDFQDEDNVNSMAFSPDGTLLAAAKNNFFDDGVVTLWDVETKQNVAIFEENRQDFHSVSFSPDGTLLAAGSDYTVKLWDVETKQNVATLEGHGRNVNSVAFSPDGTLLAAGADDYTVKLWDVETKQNVATLEGHRRNVNSVVFSPDGTLLASGAADDKVKLWDVETKQNVATFEGHQDNVNSVAISPDGAFLASGSDDGTLKLWDLTPSQRTVVKISGDDQTGFFLTQLAEPLVVEVQDKDGNPLPDIQLTFTVTAGDGLLGGEHTSVDVNTDANGRASQTFTLATDAEPNTIEVAMGYKVVTFNFQGTSQYKLVKISGDQQRQAFGSTLESPFVVEVRDWQDNSLPDVQVTFSVTAGGGFLNTDSTVEHVNTDANGRAPQTLILGNEVENTVEVTYTYESVTFNAFGVSAPYDGILIGHTDAVNSVSYSPDGSQFATGSADRTIKLWDVSTQGNTATLIGHTGIVNSVAYSSDGTLLASASSDNTIRLWDVSTQQNIYTLHGHTDAVNSVAYSSDGTLLASASSDNTVKLWDVATHTNITTFEGHTRFVYALSFSLDGTLIASGSSDTDVKLWDVSTHENIATFEGDWAIVNSLAFSPDGTILASGSNDRAVKLWDAANHTNIGIFREHTDVVTSVGFSRDGTLIASGSADNTVKLWDPATHKVIATFVGHRDHITTVTFSPDGATLATASIDGNVMLWNIDEYRTPRPSRIVIISGDSQQGVFGVPLANPLVVEVRDQYGNPLSGQTVLFTASGRLAKLNGKSAAENVTTDSSGRATIHLTPGFTVENYVDVDLVEGGLATYRLAKFTVAITSTTNTESLNADVNGDGIVNIQDLVLVASNYGQTGENVADINGDGVVHIIDMIIVAAALGTNAAAPALHTKNLSDFTAADVKSWLSQARQLNLTDATSQRGILFLEQLLAALTPKETALLHNYPNPFNPETWIPYDLAKDADVTLHIYAVNGTLVRTLALGHQAVGMYQNRSRAAHWDGRNAFGEPVASGVYFYTLTAGDFSATRKMLIRK